MTQLSVIYAFQTSNISVCLIWKNYLGIQICNFVNIAIFYISQERVFHFSVNSFNMSLVQYQASNWKKLMTKKLYYPNLSNEWLKIEIWHSIWKCLIFYLAGHELWNTVYNFGLNLMSRLKIYMPLLPFQTFKGTKPMDSWQMRVGTTLRSTVPWILQSFLSTLSSVILHFFSVGLSEKRYL